MADLLGDSAALSPDLNTTASTTSLVEGDGYFSLLLNSSPQSS